LADAISFHEEIDVAAKQNAREESYRVDGYRVYPVVGYNQVTHRSFRFAGDRAEFQDVIANQAPDGDGTVPRISAVPSGFDLTRAMFISTKHAALQSSAAALAHVIGVVSSLEYRTRAGQSMLPTQLTLQVRNVYFSPEPVVIGAVPTRAVSGLRIEITDCATGAMVEQAIMRPGTEGGYVHIFRPARGGGFRIVVTGEARWVEPASDAFEYVDLEVGSL
jgi:hypothetical protein